MSSNPDELITVCAKCLKAECGSGVKSCDERNEAGTVEMSRGELLKLELEMPWKITNHHEGFFF